MDVIKFNESDLDYFNSLLNKIEDFEVILDTLPISVNYMRETVPMLCSYYDKPEIPTWDDYRILKGFEEAHIITERKSERTYYTINDCWTALSGLTAPDDITIKTKLKTLLNSNKFINDLYHRPNGVKYSYELRIVNQLLPPEMYDEINILFNKNCIQPIRRATIDGKEHFCFFKTTGDNYGTPKALGYIGIIYIFSTDKDFIKKSTIESIFYKLLTDQDHSLPDEINEDLITKIANSEFNINDLKLEKIKTIVKSSFDKIKKVSTKKINDLNVYANDYLSRYKKVLNDLEEENNRLHMLITRSDKSVKEVLDILTKYQEKHIVLNISEKNALNCYNNKINIMLQTPLFNYNEDILNKMIKNPDRYDIDTSSFFYTLLTKAFKDDSDYEIVFTTPIAIDIADGSTLIDGFRMSGTSSKEINIAANRCMNGIPNPHLAFYNCWGQNGPELVKLLNKNKFEEYMMALIATVGNLNLSDTTVVYRFKDVVNNIGVTNKIIKFIKNKKTNELLSKAEFLKEISNDENH